MSFSEQYYASKLRESANRLPLGTQFVNSLLNDVFDVSGYCISKPNESVDIVLRSNAQNRLYSMNYADYESMSDHQIDSALAACWDSEKEYTDLLLAAEADLQEGSIVRHYKNPIDTYKVTGHSLDVLSPEVVVHYIAQYGYRLPFSRTLADFCGQVSLNGIVTRRFAVVS